MALASAPSPRGSWGFLPTPAVSVREKHRVLPAAAVPERSAGRGGFLPAGRCHACHVSPRAHGRARSAKAQRSRRGRCRHRSGFAPPAAARGARWAPCSHDCASEERNHAPRGLQLSWPSAHRFADCCPVQPATYMPVWRGTGLYWGARAGSTPQQGAHSWPPLTDQRFPHVRGAAAVASETPEWVGGKTFKFCH